MTILGNYLAAILFLAGGPFAWQVLASDAPKASVESSQYVIDLWQAEDGLPQNSVTAMVQAGDGYLWLLTEDAIARFDGTRFQVFDAADSPELSGTQIGGLISDRDGKIWLTTTKGGLLCWKDNHFERCLKDQGVAVINVFGDTNGAATIFLADGRVLGGSAGQITELAPAAQFGSPRSLILRQDRNGAIWFISQAGKLVRLKDGRFETIQPTRLRGNRFSQLAVDSAGRLWIGTDKELAVWQEGHFVAVAAPKGDSDLDVRGLLAGAGGHLWMTANNKMWVWNQNGLRLVRSPWPPFAERWTGDLADKEGNIWHSTIGRGLVRTSSDGHVLYFTAEGKLPVNRALTLCEDREGNIWAGLELGGLVRLRERRFEMVGTAEGVWSRVVLCVCGDDNGSMWLGTRGGGLFWRQDDQVKHFDLSRAGTNGIIFSVFRDRAGKVWAGTQDNGVFCFDGRHFFRPFDAELAQSQVHAIFEDHAGRLWFGHSAGIFCWQEGKLTAYGVTNGLAHPDVRAIAEDTDGKLWVGTVEGGVAQLENGQFIVPRQAKDLISDTVTSLLADVGGSMWIGTMHNGLSRFQNGKFTMYSGKNSLPDNHICAIAGDGQGNLWLGTYRGLVRISKASLKQFVPGQAKPINCLLFNKADGLATSECSGGIQPAVWRTSDGHLLFATDNGAVKFDPARLRLNPLPPPVVVEEMLVNGERVEHTRIPPGERHLEFHFTAPSLSAASKVQFRYRLEGLDSDWLESGARRNATYNYVAPGNYRFHVLACNNDGVWNETGAVLAFTLLPYFWETRWFQALFLLVLFGMVGGVVRYVTRQKLQHRLALIERQNALERERARIAQELHDDLESSLTQINFLGALAEQNDTDPEQAKQDISRIRAKAREMVLALDEIVWAVNPQNDSIRELTSYLCHTAEDFFRNSPIRCRLDVPVSLPKLDLTTEMRHNVLLATKEAFNNISKHSRATETWLRINVQGSHLLIHIEDNGVGFAADAIENGGDGLKNIRRRMGSIDGAAIIKSHPGAGTVLQLSLNSKSR